MKVIFRLAYQLGLKLRRTLPGNLGINSRIMFAVGISLTAPFSGQNLLLVEPTTAEVAATTIQATTQPKPSLPAVQYKSLPKRSLVGTVFAYSSTPGQTDASPTVTASGLNVIDGTLATNCLPFGTKVRFPTLYGNKEFTVTDRMAPRHGCASFDIWQASLTEAKQFGRQVALVEVY